MSRRASIEGPPSPGSEKPKVLAATLWRLRIQNIVIKKPEELERKPHVGPGIRKRLLEEKEKEKEKKLKEEEDKAQAMESHSSAMTKQPNELHRPVADQCVPLVYPLDLP